MSEEDRKTIDEGSLDRRLIHLDRAAFPPSQSQSHGSKGGLGKYRLAADVRVDIGRSHRSMSGVYEIGGQEYLEGIGAGQAEGDAQEDVLVVGAIDLEAQCAQVGSDRDEGKQC
jgi:hypothetical protein